MSATVAREALCAPTSAAAVGNYFLGRGWQEPNWPAVDQMKLQKLLFYAHAWYMGYNGGTPLFAEDVEAWPWGPVVRPIYYQTRDCGRGVVTRPLTELRFDPSAPLQSRFVEANVTDPTLKDFLDRVWQVHREYSGIQLSNSTHAPGEPWTLIKERYGTLDTKPIIPNELIAAVYQNKLQGKSAAT